MPSITTFTNFLWIVLAIAAPAVSAGQEIAGNGPGNSGIDTPIAPLPVRSPSEVLQASHQEPAPVGQVSNLPENVGQVPSLPKPTSQIPATPPPTAASSSVPLSVSREPQLPLSAPTRSGHTDPTKPAGSLPALATVAGSLAVVLGLFFAFAWAMKRASPRGSVLLPAEVFEILGRAPLAGRQQVHLLRCGSKLLLVSITPAGTETLTEVTDPLEVDRLAGLCRQAHPQSATAAFREVFQQLGRRPRRVAARTGSRWEEEDDG